jgi:hypothetical protein
LASRGLGLLAGEATTGVQSDSTVRTGASLTASRTVRTSVASRIPRSICGCPPRSLKRDQTVFARYRRLAASAA